MRLCLGVVLTFRSHPSSGLNHQRRGPQQRRRSAGLNGSVGNLPAGQSDRPAQPPSYNRAMSKRTPELKRAASNQVSGGLSGHVIFTVSILHYYCFALTRYNIPYRISSYYSVTYRTHSIYYSIICLNMTAYIL